MHLHSCISTASVKASHLPVQYMPALAQECQQHLERVLPWPDTDEAGPLASRLQCQLQGCPSAAVCKEERGDCSSFSLCSATAMLP